MKIYIARTGSGGYIASHSDVSYQSNVMLNGKRFHWRFPQVIPEVHDFKLIDKRTLTIGRRSLSSGDIITANEERVIWDKTHDMNDNYLSLDAEMMYRKFMQDSESITEVQVMETPVDIVYFNAFHPNDPMIKCVPVFENMVSQGRIECGDYYSYSPTSKEFFQRLCDENDDLIMDDFKLHDPDGTNLSLSKYKDQFMFHDKQSLKWRFYGTIEECKKVHEDNVKMVLDEINMVSAKLSAKKLDNVGNLIKRLIHVQDLVKKTEPKSKSHSVHSATVNEIGEMIRELLQHE